MHIKKTILRRSFFLLFIGIIIVIFFLVVVGHMHQQGRDIAENIQEPDASLILGTWESSSTDSTVLPTYWGFATTGTSTQQLRVYNKADNGVGLVLSELHNWYITQNASGTYLDIIDWDATTDNGDGDIYQIDLISSDQLIVRKVSSEDDDSDPTPNPPEVFTRIRGADQEESQSFVLSDAENTKQCSNILSGSSTDYPVLLPITCDAPVVSGGELLYFTFTPEGNIEVRRGDTLIFSLTSDEQNDADVPDILLASGALGPFLDTNPPISLADVTYDGYKDLAVKTSTGAYNFTYNYFPYDPAMKTFSKDNLFIDSLKDSTSSDAADSQSDSYFFGITNPTIDTVDKTITSDALGRGLGDIYNDDTYHFQNGKYFLIKKETQDIISDIDAATTTYIHIVQELKNGVWATTTDKIFNSDNSSNSF